MVFNTVYKTLRARLIIKSISGWHLQSYNVRFLFTNIILDYQLRL